MSPPTERGTAPASATGTALRNRNRTAYDNGESDGSSVEWPRPAREIREELFAIAAAAHDAGTGVDPVLLERYARELFECCGVIRVLGGDPAATERLARDCEETAELARLLRARA